MSYHNYPYSHPQDPNLQRNNTVGTLSPYESISQAPSQQELQEDQHYVMNNQQQPYYYYSNYLQMDPYAAGAAGAPTGPGPGAPYGGGVHTAPRTPSIHTPVGSTYDSSHDIDDASTLYSSAHHPHAMGGGYQGGSLSDSYQDSTYRRHSTFDTEEVPLVGAAAGVAVGTAHSHPDEYNDASKAGPLADDMERGAGGDVTRVNSSDPYHNMNSNKNEYEYSSATILDNGYNNRDSNIKYLYPPPELSPPRTIAEILRERPHWIKRAIWDTTPMKDRRELYKNDIGVQNRPWVCWTLVVVMTAVFIYELVAQATKGSGSPFVNPKYNPMLGPQSEMLIYVGARFTACMKSIPEISAMSFSCFGKEGDTSCTQTLEDMCGFGGFNNETPNQSFRFFIPVWLHAGIIHLALNMFAQCVVGSRIEKLMGSIKFVFVYFAAGIFGFILGGNFALVGQPSVGASGALYGIQAAILVDLISHWSLLKESNTGLSPRRRLIYLIIELIIGFALGYVPGIDNFAHIGGFSMGFLMCLLLFPVIYEDPDEERRKLEKEGKPIPQRKRMSGVMRKKIIFRGLAFIAIPGIILLYVLLARNFYTDDPAAACEGCRYLSCWPTSQNNHCKGTGLSTTTTNSSS